MILNNTHTAPLSDHARGWWFLRALSAACCWSVVLAVGEVLVRYGFSPDPLGARELACGVYVNVAALGALTVVIIAAGGLADVVIRKGFRAPRVAVHAYRECALPAAGVAGLVVATEVVGLGDQYPIGPFSTALVIGILLWIVIAWAKRTQRFLLSQWTRIGVVAAWLLCGVNVAVSVNETQDYLRPWLHADGEPEASQDKRSANIVLVVLDTLRADRVGVYNDTSLTPNLDELAESSAVYTRAISTAPWTLPAHASLLTGLYPDRHGGNWAHYALDEKDPTLPELLQERGYETVAISNNWLVSEENGYARGFDLFLETPRDPVVRQWRLALRCGIARWLGPRLELSTAAGHDAGSTWTNWLLNRKLTGRSADSRPLFLFVNYFEPHDPYVPVEPFAEMLLDEQQRRAARRLRQSELHLAAHACGAAAYFSQEQITLMRALYDAEVAYQDHMVGQLVETLRRTGLLDNTWLVVTSDHGELFGEWNMVYHTASAHYNLLHVPLIVRPPGGMESRRIADAVQPVDIFRTLTEAAGVTLPSNVRRALPLPMKEQAAEKRKICVAQTYGASIAGLSMSQRVNMQADLSRWLTWITSVYRDGYLLELTDRGPRALYHVIVDPSLNQNLLETAPDVAKQMMKLYEDWQRGPGDGEEL